MSEVQLRQLLKDEIGLLPGLMENCFSMKVDKAYFKWKYLDNPVGNFIGFGAFFENKLVGFYGVIPERYQINNSEVIIFQSGDTMTHSTQRRKGLFEKLATLCYNYVREHHQLAVIGFGGDKSTPGLVKMGWCHIADVKYFFIHALHCKWINNFTTEDRNFNIVEKTDIHVILDIQKNFGFKKNIKQHYSKEFLKWRLANPRFNYRCFICYQGQNPVGYVICYEDEGKLFLLDYCSISVKVQKTLIRRLSQICIKSKLKGIITIAIPKSEEGKWLKKAGFLRNPFKKGPLTTNIPFMILTDQKPESQLCSKDQWQVTPICHDAL